MLLMRVGVRTHGRPALCALARLSQSLRGRGPFGTHEMTLTLTFISRKCWGNSRCVVPGERIVEIRNGMDGFQERRQYSFSKLPEATSNNQDHQGCLGREERRA